MRHNHPQICLYQPEIPQNTGNIARLAAATGCRLNLVEPFGFSTQDKNLRRPGLDYWPYLDLEIHSHFESLVELYGSRLAFFSKKASKVYTKVPNDTELLVFGRETSGLPDQLFQQFPENFYNIPMFHSGVRSLNLANAVSIVVYDQLSRRGLMEA